MAPVSQIIADLFVLYIGDLYLFERLDGVLELFAYRETKNDAWKELNEDTITKVSEASIISKITVPKINLDAYNETDTELKYVSWDAETSINRYTGSYSKTSTQVFTTVVDPNSEVSRTDNYVGTCTKADKAKF